MGWMDGVSKVLRLTLYQYRAVNSKRKQTYTEKYKNFRNQVIEEEFPNFKKVFISQFVLLWVQGRKASVNVSCHKPSHKRLSPSSPVLRHCAGPESPGCCPMPLYLGMISQRTELLGVFFVRLRPISCV